MLALKGDKLRMRSIAGSYQALHCAKGKFEARLEHGFVMSVTHMPAAKQMFAGLACMSNNRVQHA